ncbi:hypothetical protein KP509_01G052500 [Ceratopteris richardii]|uniref:Uncharacterized protein n=1 Tax=Ceratopteris richardii TaxID=49495 RepID=A0A8T2VL82_CERRI|nr:hypothetical protein KP509_01G052500 [Ceratopteris richardii]
MSLIVSCNDVWLIGQTRNKVPSTTATKDSLTSSASHCQAATEAEHKDDRKEKKPNKRLFYNIRRCCLTLPKMTISERLNYLSGTLCDQLWKWLIAPNRIEYADTISRLIPLDEES